MTPQPNNKSRSKKFYGKSVLETPLFSSVDVQRLLNEIKSKDARIKELEAGLVAIAEIPIVANEEKTDQHLRNELIRMARKTISTSRKGEV